jgi:hypothetical protein
MVISPSIGRRARVFGRVLAAWRRSPSYIVELSGAAPAAVGTAPCRWDGRPCRAAQRQALTFSASSERGAHSCRGHEQVLRQPVIAMAGGQELEEHNSPVRRPSRCCTDGCASSRGRRCGRLPRGHADHPPARHRLLAFEDAVALLTVAKVLNGKVWAPRRLGPNRGPGGRRVFWSPTAQPREMCSRDVSARPTAGRLEPKWDRTVGQSGARVVRALATSRCS